MQATITEFTDLFPKVQTRRELTNTDILEPKEYPRKKDMPLIVMATFGEVLSSKGILRHGDNITSLTGITLDYDNKDGSEYDIATLRQRLKDANVCAWFYTTPTHSPDHPKWRVLAPLLRPYKGSRAEMEAYLKAGVAYLEEILGVDVAKESSTLSQSFYIGRSRLSSEYIGETVHGMHIDENVDLEQRAYFYMNNSGDGVDVQALTTSLNNSENYHEALVSLAGVLIQQGVNKQTAILSLQGQMMSVETRRDEWEDRFNDIERIVDWVLERESKKEISLQKKKEVTPKKSSSGSYLQDLVDRFAVTNDDVREMKETKFIYHNVIPEGHLIAIIGQPGAGKTTVMEFIAGQIQGTCWYINGDIASGDIKEAHRRAEAGNYHLLCPDIKVGMSMASVAEVLTGLSQSDEDLTGQVFVIDTLKKIAEVINKNNARAIYHMLRKLTSRGATVICLAHTNKYPGEDKWPVYEGTADLRSDFDEMVLLYGMMTERNKMVTSLYWKEDGWEHGKARAQVQRMSWDVDLTAGARIVTEAPFWVDTVGESREAKAEIKYETINADIAEFILKCEEPPNKTTLLGAFPQYGERVLRDAIANGMDKYWVVETGDRHTKYHKLTEAGYELTPESMLLS